MSKTQHKTLRGGYLHKFPDDLNRLQDHKADFRVISSGLSRKIVFPEKDNYQIKRLYFGHSKGDILPGVHMVNSVRRSIDSYIEKGGKIPIIKHHPKLILYNFQQIERALESNPPELTYAIDINACYFRTAYNLGFISKSLYDKGWEKRKEHKLGLLASIGSLNKHETIEIYKKGKLKKTDLNWEYKERYSPFYWAVINYVAKVMMEIAHALDNNFYMWLTDCIYIDKQDKDIVEQILNKHKYDYKNFFIEFEAIDDQQIKWYDFKANEKKFINHNFFLNYTPAYTPFTPLSNTL